VPFEPKLPEGQALPPGFSVNTADPRYKALHDLATRARRDRVFLVAVRNVRFRAPYERTPAADAMDGAP
jgi:hypothetical protein